ncbi:MAG: hypothetical protein MUF64_16335 [Polyangiaceae bacterium]|nr:hypothetical protein [Polyangiaceae bacterium]
MTPRSLRLRLLLAVVPALPGCAAPSQGGGSGMTPPPPAQPQASSSPAQQPASLRGARVWMSAGLVCMSAAHTRQRFGPPAAPPFESCQDWPDHDFVVEQLGSAPCGPCAFTFIPEQTRSERQQTPDACCYRAESPPGPGRALLIGGHSRQAMLVRG